LSGDACLTGEEYGRSRASVVYYCEDGVVSFAGRELGDQVHGYDLERECVGRCGDAVERDLCSFCKVLALLALSAPFYVLRDPFVHVWPPEVSADDCDGGVSSWVSSDFQVVESVEDFLFQDVVWWDGDSALYAPVLQVIVIVRGGHSCLVAFDPSCDLGGVLSLHRPYPSF
jgi:hypothetical protein